MSVPEKAGMFRNGMQPVKRLQILAYSWWSEALHGVAFDGVATSFPQICGVAATLNRTLWKMIGSATGLEARGLNNARSYNNRNYKGLSMWAPNVNIFRDPR